MRYKVIILITLSILELYSCKNDNAIMKHPIDSKATTETVELYNFLFNTMDKGIMLAHQDALAYGHDWYKEDGRSDVKDITGDYPAVIGWELGHLELGHAYNLDSVYFSDMKKYIKDTYRRGGITTMSWHGDNIVTGNNAWDCKLDTVVKSVLPGAENHVKFLTWLDNLAAFFLDLKDDQGKLIPVVLRLYHEHTGDWFWWCSKQCTPDEYKEMWKMTVNYLKETKGVHNLLYAYSPIAVKDEAEFLERYPGDDYVDVIGFDAYVQVDNPEGLNIYKEQMKNNIDITLSYAEKSGKLPTISETGMESIGDSTYFTQIVYPLLKDRKLSWVLFWRNAWESDKPHHFYLPFVGHPAATNFLEFTNNEDILMNNDIKR